MSEGRYQHAYIHGQSLRYLPILNTKLSLSTLAPGSSLTRYSISPEGSNSAQNMCLSWTGAVTYPGIRRRQGSLQDGPC